MDILSSALARFRQSFRGFFPYNADAAIELVDSLSTNLQAKSPVELSLNPCYSRHYSSLPHVIGGYYKSRETSIEESRKALDNANEKIQHSLCQNIGMDSGAEYHLFAIDWSFDNLQAQKISTSN